MILQHQGSLFFFSLSGFFFSSSSSPFPLPLPLVRIIFVDVLCFFCWFFFLLFFISFFPLCISTLLLLPFLLLPDEEYIFFKLCRSTKFFPKNWISNGDLEWCFFVGSGKVQIYLKDPTLKILLRKQEWTVWSLLQPQPAGPDFFCGFLNCNYS